MKGRSIFIILVAVVCIVMSSFDRYVHRIPNAVYFPIAICGVIVILIGVFTIR